MEIDASSSESNSSSDYSSSDDEELETVCVGGARVHIPQGLCENKDIFQEFFSEPTWNNLSDASKHHLRSYLPYFLDNDDEEREVTLRRLFNRQNFKFGTPFDNFFKHLQAGHYRPDIARMRLLIRKAERKEAKLRHRKYRDQLELEVKESRKKLLAQMANLPPGSDIRQEHKNNINVQSALDPIDYRTKKRYFQELANIKGKIGESGVSSDESYPEGAPVGITRKQKKHLNGLKNELSSTGEKLILSTLSLKQNGFDLERSILPNHNPFTVTEDSFKKLIANHRKRKLDFGGDVETNCNGLTMSDIIQRTRLDYKKLPLPAIKNNEYNKATKKKHKHDYRRSLSPEMLKLSLLNDHTSLSELESDSDSCTDPVHNISTKRKGRVRTPTKSITVLSEAEIKVEPVEEIIVPRECNSPFTVEPVKVEEPIKIETVDTTKNYRTATLSDLDGIDMMNIPIELDESEILDFNRPELMQETHSNFLSLIRDIICSTSEHRMDMSNLRERLRIWQENPISPLNDWYSSTDNWLNLLQSAISFLSGNSFEQPDDFVPYIEYKPQLDMYQWIGAGRDSDLLLANLCNYWLEHKQEDRTSPVVKDDLDVELIDRVQTPPPPRFPTSWSVQKADEEEIRLYRDQEKQRYDNPHKSFTYRCNGYESVVGPIKGIYNSSTSNTKARGHNMLCADRPNFVTILSLVRDAVARLPNGEGTRAEICELLKCSQYISSTAPDNILQSVVSGALDRMHTQFDPCVKYDSKRKIWIYLHRNRSEEDFDRLHQQYQMIGRNIKKNVKVRAPPKPKVVKPQESKTAATSEEVISKPQPPSQPNSLVNVKTIKVLPEPSNIVVNAEEQIKPATVVPVSTPIAVAVAKPSPKPVIKSIPATSSLLHENVKQSIQKSMKRPKIITQVELSQTKSIPADIVTTQIRRPIQQESVLQQNNFVNANTINTTTTTHTILSQDIIHTLTAHKSQQHQVVIKQESSEVGEKKVHHQLIQSLTPQQLQNIKNVTLLRNVTPSSGASIVLQSQVETTSSSSISLSQPANNIVTALTNLSTQPQLRLQQQQILSNSAQQQILTSLKQKVVPTSIQVANISAMQTQNIVVKQKPINAITKTIPAGTSLLGTTTEVSTAKPTIAQSSVPLVAKVLTNAAGQVISVESLLAHQKQHGSLPQGTTLRVSGGKGAHSNIIQLSSASKATPQHITVSAQNQLMSLISQQQQHQQQLQSQPKLIVSSAQLATTLAASNATNTKLTKTIIKPQITSAKFTSRIGPQIINARFVTEPNKLNQTQKVIIGPNQIRFNSKATTITKPANTIRMVNASNLSGLNIGHISGKPVLLASKSPASLHNLQSGNIIIQSQPNTSGTMNNVTVKTCVAGTTAFSQPGQVLFSSPQQLRMQQHQLVQVKGNSVTTQGGQILLGGQQVRLQNASTATGNVSNTQRLLLASQGQGGQIVAQQILLPAGFQGTAINIKGLQGVKVIPIAAGQAAKNLPRQVFARVMSPSRSVAAPQINLTSSSDSSDTNTPTID